MATSFPSNTITSINIPEVVGFDAEFVYNFFVPDEKTNENGSRYSQGTDEDLVSGKRRNLEVKIPRWVEFSFSPVTIISNATLDNEFVAPISRPQDVERLIKNNLSKIQSELDVSSKSTSAMIMQDISFRRNAARVLNLAVAIRGYVSGNRPDKAKFLNSVTTARVDGNLLLQAMNVKSMYGVRYQRRLRTSRRSRRDWYRGKRAARNKFATIQNTKAYAQINDKFLKTIVAAGERNSLNPFSGKFSEMADPAEKLQSSARSKSRIDAILGTDFSSVIIPISYRRADDDVQNAAKVIGYIVDKQEITASGAIKNLEPIILTSPNIGAALDAKIKYDAVYRYSIRAIALVQLQGTSQRTGETIAVSGLVTSRASKAVEVKCEETTPPPPPADFNFVWDYRIHKLNLLWSFPPNPQQDIKTFQVFRRSSIWEPFTLLVEYDFDNSEVPTPRVETPNVDAIIDCGTNPMTFFVDDEFTKDSNFIYALCAVDAHQYTSNYSIQFAVGFDRYKNVLTKELVSAAGAPKPYPNFLLEEELTSVAMKDSNHFNARIYFDPEYLTIVDGNGEDMEVLATNKNEGTYKLSFINIERQKSQIVTFNVEDIRDE